MSQKPKHFKATPVNLDSKNIDDLFPPPSTMGGRTGSEFNFDDKILNSSSRLKPSSCHNLRNIFDDVNNQERKKYKDEQIGPRYEDDKKEKIVKWSIVGKPEQFLSVRNYKNRQKVVIKTRKQDGDESFSEDNMPSMKPQLQASQSQMSGMGQQRKTPKKPRGEFKMLPRQDALIKMVEAKRRIEINKQEQQKIEQKLPLHLRNAFSRDKRNLESYQTLQEKWEFLNNQIASNCERSPKATIMSRSDNYRERNQIVNMIETIKNEDEKYNNRLWYMRLRWYDHKDERVPFSLNTKNKPKTTPLTSRLVERFVRDTDAEHLNQQQNFVLSDIQSNFNAKVIDNPYEQVERVIKNADYNKLYSKKLEQIFDHKLKDKPKKRFVDTKEYLEINGQNAFSKEFELIKKDKQSQEYQYFEEKQDEQEVYVDNWNVSQLAKTGQPIFTSL